MACTSTRPSPGWPSDPRFPAATEGDGDRVAALEAENARLRRICAALIERVESGGVPGGGPYAAFEHSVLLAEQVRERTETLQQTLAALNRAKAEAEAANLSKTRFLAAVSHDLLQPLNAARLFASALEGQALPGESRRLVTSIGRSLKDVEALIGSLVDISRLEAGVLRPDVSAFPAEELLGVLAEEYRQLATSRGLELRYVPTRAMIESDLSLLARVVRNFLGNAIRYTARGRILLGCRRRPDGLEIQVGDTGPGIAPEQQRAIFEEFRRLGGEGAGDDRGLGLGLAIVDRIGGMLGHPLSLASHPGRGSLFSVRVPYGRSSGPREAPVPEPAALPLEGARIWVVDNDADIRDGMAALLGGWGCRVLTAAAPAELAASEVSGAEVSGADVPGADVPGADVPGADALLVDYHLGEGEADGLAVADRLRTRFPGLPVVVITANHAAELKARVRQAGYEYLLKPVKPLRLRLMLTALLEAQRGRCSAR
ncbi:ATP-binding response regulator [Halomonas ramblicola]|uniref:ATP-binding response regulator n=1 Tax=Halomonas ramblicola TaxID=747349 RepID=UPI0025B30F12|nr:hybrid sensor histidine kinase/response regulator [Halomonas ramblicola]MDN3521703.1 hybrid sensor histidine kinase/response regulator [Halomonas ramblicola]